MVEGVVKPSLCVYGHFYQPPRDDPFTGVIAPEYGAAPYPNFNEKITAECYRPNAEAGNFERISFNLGPTLAEWLERAHPDVYARILAADRAHVAQHGVGNALAQVYNHTILPLANHRDKQVQIEWGLADFARRFGRRAEGMWLAETAVDMETLDLLAQRGVRYTVLAPWQSAQPIDATQPYFVRLAGGRAITIFFFNGPVSGLISFDGAATADAGAFAASSLPLQINQAKASGGEPQLIVLASDGELYGHHKPWRDQFLKYLLTRSAPALGFEVTTLGRYLRDHPATAEVTLRVPSAWSCAHGMARWATGCSCTPGDSSWKSALRHAFDQLGEQVDELFVRALRPFLDDPWAARQDYLAYRSGLLSAETFWERHRAGGAARGARSAAARTDLLLAAEYYAQRMYTSCGFYGEDLDGIESRNNIAFARRAIGLVRQATGEDHRPRFLRDLVAARSWRTGLSGLDLYRQLPS